MKIQPVASPHMIAPTGAQTSTQQDARQRAIAKLTAVPTPPPQQNVNHSPQLNQNAIAPEDMTAIRQSKPAQIDESIAESIETPESSVQETPPPAKPEVDERTSQEWAKLARQEKALRQKALQQEQQLKAREAALAAKEAELLGKTDQYKDYIPKSQLKQDALKLLAEAGVSYEDLTQQILNQQPVNPQVEAQISRLQAQIEAQAKLLEQQQKAQADQQSQAYQAAVKQIEADAKRLVFTDPNFETIKSTNSVKDVVELITKTYDQDGILLSVEEAAQQVEDYLIEEAMKITKIEKIQKKLGLNAQKSQETKPQLEQKQQPQPTMKTLTNANASASRLSAKERAILAFKGELK